MIRINTGVLVIAGLLCFAKGAYAQKCENITFDFDSQQQTIHSFGASDCWRTQYIGCNWPDEKRNKIADLLFSTEVDEWGNPKGIGLSLWRFNIGSGSHEAGDAGGVASLWRRTECFLGKNGDWNWDKQEGQRWMLQAARDRGLRYSLGFSITAPYFMTKNGMARASERTPYANLREDCYDDYASFMAEVCKHLDLDYISPINEPQWEWVGSNQEGMQATNEECCRLIHALDAELNKREARTKIVFGEAGDIRHLFRSGTDKKGRNNQLHEMFALGGEHSIASLSSVAPVVSGHSYWSTWPLDTLIRTRTELKDAMKTCLPEQYSYWQTEYCPMEKNADNPQGGGGRDLGMNTALYIARVIHHDLAVANATSWQWWTAFSEWNYKDGLIFIDDGILSSGAMNGNEKMIETCKKDGVFRTSKTLWALGNFSFFIRPGMVRLAEAGDTSVELALKSARGLMASAYVDKATKQVVVVLVNYSEDDKEVELVFDNLPKGYGSRSFKFYETSERSDLQYKRIVNNKTAVPARSIVTLVGVN